ncbi:unnamed protein product, partial [Larinioides sclopetarius]
GPYLLPDRLDGQKYIIFPQKVLPGLLQNASSNVRRIMCSSTTEYHFIFPGMYETTWTLPFRTVGLVAEGPSLGLPELPICPT